MKIKTKSRIDHLEVLLRRVREASRFNERTYRIRKYLGSFDAKLHATFEAYDAMERGSARPARARIHRQQSRPVEGNQGAGPRPQEAEGFTWQVSNGPRIRNPKPSPPIPSARRAHRRIGASSKSIRHPWRSPCCDKAYQAGVDRRLPVGCRTRHKRLLPELR